MATNTHRWAFFDDAYFTLATSAMTLTFKLTISLVTLFMLGAPLATSANETSVGALENCSRQAGDRKGLERKEFMKECLNVVKSKHEAFVAKEQDAEHKFSERQAPTCSSESKQEAYQCVTNEFQMVDQELNRLYAELAKILANPKGIRNSQRAWLRFRDAECSNDVMQIGGESMYAIARYSCMIELTQERMRRLRWHLAQDCNGCPILK